MTRWSGVLAVVAVLACVSTAHADEAADAAALPFRAKLVTNAVLARKAASSLSSIAKQSPPKRLSADERKAWAEQSKVLSAGAARLAALKVRMDAVLSKTHAPASEIAQASLELADAQTEIEKESQRCAVGSATKSRHEAAMRAIR